MVSPGGKIDFRSLEGLVPFAEAEALQLDLVERRIRDEVPDTVLFLEHAPVVTRGRGLQFTGETRARAMPLGPLPPGTEYAECARGGDLTWHGPGQLVVYPILKITDLGAYLRGLERAAISVIEALAPGLRAFSRANAAGVWVAKRGTGSTLPPMEAAPTETPLKIASLGVAVRKWVTYHGLALNCVNDPTGFALISPCGYAPEVMTRLADHAAIPPSSGDWRGRVEGAFRRALSGAG